MLSRKIFSGKLSILAKIPVHSATPLVYRKRDQFVSRAGLGKRGVQVMLGIPVLKWLTALAQNYRHDPLYIYGFFMKKGTALDGFRCPSDLVSELLNHPVTGVSRLLKPNLRRPILMQSLRGLFSARYLCICQNRKGSAGLINFLKSSHSRPNVTKI